MKIFILALILFKKLIQKVSLANTKYSRKQNSIIILYFQMLLKKIKEFIIG